MPVPRGWLSQVKMNDRLLSVSFVSPEAIDAILAHKDKLQHSPVTVWKDLVVLIELGDLAGKVARATARAVMELRCPLFMSESTIAAVTMQ